MIQVKLNSKNGGRVTFRMPVEDGEQIIAICKKYCPHIDLSKDLTPLMYKLFSHTCKFIMNEKPEMMDKEFGHKKVAKLATELLQVVLNVPSKRESFLEEYLTYYGEVLDQIL